MKNIRAVIRNSVLGVLVCFNPVYSMCLSEWIFGKKQVIVKESPTAVQSIKKWASEPGNIAIGIIVCYVCFNFLRSILDFKDEHDDSFFNVPAEIKPTNSIKKKNHNFIGLNTIIIDPIHIITDQGQSIIEPDCQKVEAAHLESSIEGSVEGVEQCVDQKDKEAIHKNMNPITVNGKNMDDILKLGQEVVYEDLETDNIAFKIENGNITIGSTDISNLQDRLDFFAKRRNDTCRMTIKTKKYSLSGDFHELNHQYVSSDQELTIDVKKNVFIAGTTFKAKKVKIITQEIECALCFADTDELEIEVRSETSLYATIRFIRNKNNQNPMILVGKLDFAKNITHGIFTAVGAKKVTIAFSPEVFQ